MKYVANTQGMPDAVSKNFRDIERAMKQLSGSTSVRSGEQQTPSPVTIPIFDKKASSVTVDPFGDIVAVTVQTALQELDTEKQPLIETGTTLQYWRGDKTWQELNTAAVVESTNLYFTNLRAQSAITGGASSIVTSNLTASRALASDASGKVAVAATTLAELNFVSGLTSNAQTQFNAKAPLASPAFTGTVTGITAAMVGLGSVTNDAQVKRAEMGVANGVSTLGADTKVPLSQIPVALLGQVHLSGLWNASTNTPTLPATPTTNGDYYIVTVAGATSLGGITDWKVGDWIIANGGVWGKVDNTDSVVTVNGYSGTVVLTKSDVGLSAVENTALSTWAGSANITTVGNAAVLNKPLTGYVVGANTAFAATDTVLAAFQKVQGQINARPVAGNTGITTLGTVATGTWNATAIAANKGGTGQTSYTVGDLLYASSATALSKLADVAAGNVLRSGGVGVAPAWGKVALTDHAPGTTNRVLKSVAGGFADSALTEDGSTVTSSLPIVIYGAATMSENPGRYGALQVNAIKEFYHGISLPGAMRLVFMSSSTGALGGLYNETNARWTIQDGEGYTLLSHPTKIHLETPEVKCSNRLTANALVCNPSLGVPGYNGIVDMRGKSFFDLQSSGTSVTLGLGDIGQILTVVSNSFTSGGAIIDWIMRTTSGESAQSLTIDRCRVGLFQCVWARDANTCFWSRIA